MSVKRGDKSFPMTSPEIEREIGGHVKLARGWKVNLDHPELTISVELLPAEAFYSLGKERGAGGMPTGVSGRVACLLSGGIDSPVAAYRIERRGCSVMLVHFHSYPFLSRASQEKVREIAQLLTRHQMHTVLCLVPFGELQRQVVVGVPQGLRVVIYRRLMLRIAERLAREWSAGALVTGEVIGQVASQTLENLSVIAVGDDDAGCAAARRDGQGRDRRRGPDRSGPTRSRSSRTRTAASSSRRATRRRARSSRRWKRRNASSRLARWSRRRSGISCARNSSSPIEASEGRPLQAPELIQTKMVQ